MDDSNKTQVIGFRVTNKEYKKLESQARNRQITISQLAKERTLNDDCSLLQLRMNLSEMENTLSNILLGEKIISANMTEMFRNLCLRVKEKDISKITEEEGEKLTRGVENSINKVKNAAMDSVFNHYTNGDSKDPLCLDEFAQKIEKL